MNDLLSLNLFAMSLPAALIGMGLFGGLVLLPLFFHDDRKPHAPHGGAMPRPSH